MKTVLVVDDDKTFTGLMRTIFELEGYQALILNNPEKVVATAREVHPALIVMDVHTGRHNTLDALKELRADETLDDVGVVMNSGMDHRTECLEAGADVFMLKPFRPSELLRVVENLIE